MHYIDDEGELAVNRTLVELTKILNSQDLTNQYFDNANEQVFEQLIKDDFEIDTRNEDVNFKSLYTDKQQKTWIDKEKGKLVLGIITYTTPQGVVKTKKITSSVDLIPIAKELGLPENASLKDIRKRIESSYSTAQKIQVNINEISPKSEAFGVFIDPRLEKATWQERQQIFREWQNNNPNGIVAYRVSYNNYNSPAEAKLGHIGNPFSKNANGPKTVQ